MNMLVENAAQAAYESRKKGPWGTLPDWAREEERRAVRAAFRSLDPIPLDLAFVQRSGAAIEWNWARVMEQLQR